MVDQHAGQDNFSSLAANLHRLFRQLSGLFVIGLLRVADFQLGQQRQRIPVTVIGRFLRPVFGLLIIAVTDVGIGKIVLRRGSPASACCLYWLPGSVAPAARENSIRSK
jgi:hypothetical protein